MPTHDFRASAAPASTHRAGPCLHLVDSSSRPLMPRHSVRCRHPHLPQMVRGPADERTRRGRTPIIAAWRSGFALAATRSGPAGPSQTSGVARACGRRPGRTLRRSRSAGRCRGSPRAEPVRLQMRSVRPPAPLLGWPRNWPPTVSASRPLRGMSGRYCRTAGQRHEAAIGLIVGAQFGAASQGFDDEAR